MNRSIYEVYMSNNINAHCKICGKGYYSCNSCLAQKTIKPWRSIVDSIEHYKIYLIIHEYTISKNKENAKQALQAYDLSGLETFNPEIKAVINEIMSESQRTKSSSRIKKVYKDNTSNVEYVPDNKFNE